jgi:tetratricopeptide (TPR) repeat protein
MIKLVHDSADSAPGFGALALMRSLERQLAAKQHKPSDEAQDLFYDALDAPTEAKEFALIKKVLQLDPGHTDALLVALGHRPLEQGDQIEALGKIVAVAEKRLGPNAFEKYAGSFWGFHETRPYMRARGQLAAALQDAGRIEEAIIELEAMLELNPNDNQGLRYALLPCYLSLQRLDGAARLFVAYDECDWNTVFAWGRVLERWLMGDTTGAQQALAVARKQNGHSEAYLRGHKRLPKHVPETYSPGSKEEAQCFAGSLRMIWQTHPKALAWLAAQLGGRRGPAKKPVKRAENPSNQTK